MLKLLLADDHALFRSGLAGLLLAMGGIAVVAEAADAHELFKLLEMHRDVHLLTLDLKMPGNNGVELVKEVASRYPSLPVLVVSMFAEASIVTAAIRAGATGFVSKGCDVKVLQEAIYSVALGKQFIEPSLEQAIAIRKARVMGTRFEGILSLREEQVLTLILRGMRLGAIAEMLFLSSKTVSAHKRQIKRKLGVSNDVDLYRYANDFSDKS